MSRKPTFEQEHYWMLVSQYTQRIFARYKELHGVEAPLLTQRQQDGIDAMYDRNAPIDEVVAWLRGSA